MELLGSVKLELKVLKQLFRNGALSAATVVPASIESDRWLVVIETKHGLHERMTRANSKKEKLFRSLPAAFEDLRRIGFKQATVTFPNEDVPIRKR